MHKKTILAMAITCSLAHSYRRANIKFMPGENNFDSIELSEEQIAQIEKDPFLSVDHVECAELPDAATSKSIQSTTSLSKQNNQKSQVEAGTSEDTQGLVDGNALGDGIKVDIDLSNAPEELQVFIAGIHLLNAEAPLAKKPTVDQLEVEVAGDTEGETLKVKPTAVQRDSAWDWYQQHVDQIAK